MQLYFSSWRKTWEKWSRANRLAALAALVAIVLGIVQAAQLVIGTASWMSEKIYGPPPLDLPLPQILTGAMSEVEYNIDCLQSYEILRTRDAEYSLCHPKRRYLDSLFHHISVLTSRDHYSDSTRTWSDWKLASNYYEKLEKTSTKSEFLQIENESDVTLRDALFLTGYIRYFYRNFYKEIENDGCVPFGKIESRCRPVILEMEKIAKHDAEEVARWSNMPAKYALDEGKPVESYVDWLSLND